MRDWLLNLRYGGKSSKFPLALPEIKISARSSRIVYTFVIWLILMQNIIYLMGLGII